MSIDIKGMDPGPVGAGAVHPIERVRAVANVAPGASPSGSASTSDSVSITGLARTLASLQDAVGGTPDVDAKRVEQLRMAVDRGSYVPNPARIADRMLQLETDLAAATGRPTGYTQS